MIKTSAALCVEKDGACVCSRAPIKTIKTLSFSPVLEVWCYDFNIVCVLSVEVRVVAGL